MNSTNDDATKPIASRGYTGAPAGDAAHGDGDSTLAALKGEVTSRIQAVKSGSDESAGGEVKSTSRSRSRSSSRTGSGAVDAQTPSAGTARTFTAVNSGSAASSAGSAPSAAPKKASGRRVRLTLSRIDPWSVMKFSFLAAIAVGISTVVAVALLWNMVDAIGLWDRMDSILRDLNSGKPMPFMEYFEFTKMISYATVIAFLNVIIITALGTLLAFLYNIVAALLGGLKVTFTDR